MHSCEKNPSSTIKIYLTDTCTSSLPSNVSWVILSLQCIFYSKIIWKSMVIPYCCSFWWVTLIVYWYFAIPCAKRALGIQDKSTCIMLEGEEPEMLCIFWFMTVYVYMCICMLIFSCLSTLYYLLAGGWSIDGRGLRSGCLAAVSAAVWEKNPEGRRDLPCFSYHQVSTGSGTVAVLIKTCTRGLWFALLSNFVFYISVSDESTWSERI